MKKKLIPALILCFLVTTIIGTSADYSKRITALFYNVKVNYNGNDLNFKSSPFIYNGYVYAPVNDLAPQTGFTYTWNNDTKTMNLYPSQSSTNTESLRAELDRKNLEIANLKMKLSQSDLYKNISNNSSSSNSSRSSDSLDDLEDILEDKFDRHRNDGETLEFDNYELSKSSNTIYLKMYGDFDKNYSKWRNRDSSDFKDFIEDICEKIADDYDEDINVRVYDDDKDQIEKYTYDTDDERLYSGSSNNDTDLDDLESELEDDYDSVTNDGHTLKFKNYNLRQLSNDDIEIKIYTDFDRTSSYWKNRDKEDFRDFIEKVCKKVSRDYDEDMDITVYDDDNSRTAEYDYDEDDNDLNKQYEY